MSKLVGNFEERFSRVTAHIMSIVYSRGGVMDSVFAEQSRGCGFETRLVHMPVMLVTNVHPDVIKANRP